MKRTMHSSAMAMGAVAVVLALLSGCISTAQTNGLNLLNRTRVANGQTALTQDAQLMDKAQAWSAHLASTGKLTHSTQTAGITECQRSLGEIIGEGPSITNVMDAWMSDKNVNPPIHRNDILDPDFDHGGFGVTVKNGTYWVVAEFLQTC